MAAYEKRLHYPPGYRSKRMRRLVKAAETVVFLTSMAVLYHFWVFVQKFDV